MVGFEERELSAGLRRPRQEAVGVPEGRRSPTNVDHDVVDHYVISSCLYFRQIDDAGLTPYLPHVAGPPRSKPLQGGIHDHTDSLVQIRHRLPRLWKF